jgi:hypothetical protein
MLDFTMPVAAVHPLPDQAAFNIGPCRKIAAHVAPFPPCEAVSISLSVKRHFVIAITALGIPHG